MAMPASSEIVRCATLCSRFAVPSRDEESDWTSSSENLFLTKIEAPGTAWPVSASTTETEKSVAGT